MVNDYDVRCNCDSLNYRGGVRGVNNYALFGQMKNNGFKTWLRLAYDDGSLAGWFCLITSITLLVLSFALPPLAIIDNSVLAGVGELFAFGVLFKLPAMVQSIKDGRKLRLQHGNTTIEVESDEGK